jgi:hypothetical protein
VSTLPEPERRVTYPDNAPILDFDPSRDAVLEPHLAIEKFDVPPHVVLCFFRDAIASFVELSEAVRSGGSRPSLARTLSSRSSSMVGESLSRRPESARRLLPAGSTS